jgi:hypothetical protein
MILKAFDGVLKSLYDASAIEERALKHFSILSENLIE